MPVGRSLALLSEACLASRQWSLATLLMRKKSLPRSCRSVAASLKCFLHLVFSRPASCRIHMQPKFHILVKLSSAECMEAAAQCNKALMQVAPACRMTHKNVSPYCNRANSGVGSMLANCNGGTSLYVQAGGSKRFPNFNCRSISVGFQVPWVREFSSPAVDRQELAC